MRQQFQYQIILLVLLAPILACSGFTISGRTTGTATATATAARNRQLQSRPELLQVQAQVQQLPSLTSNLLKYHQQSASPSSSLSLAATSGDNDSDNDNDSDSSEETTPGNGEVEEIDVNTNVNVDVPGWKRVLFFYKYNKDGSIKSKSDDGLTFKQKLAKMGLSALLSYGFVSNMSYCVAVGLAWFGFSKKTGLSPLAPGQWKGFLAVYAGFYVFNNIVRPIRLAVSVGVTPYFDRAIAAVQRKTKLSKGASIGIVVFLANICGTFSLMGLFVYIASLASGIPIFPPKVLL